MSTSKMQELDESDHWSHALKLELERARAKFPTNDKLFWALVEEVGELGEALRNEPSQRIRAEALQVACVAVRIYEEGDAEFVARNTLAWPVMESWQGKLFSVSAYPDAIDDGYIRLGIALGELARRHLEKYNIKDVRDASLHVATIALAIREAHS